MLCVMADMSVSAARSRLADVIDDARVHHAPVFLTRRGRRVAAVIDAEDLERLTQAAEDLADIEAARAARAEVAEHGTIPLGRGQGGPRTRMTHQIEFTPAATPVASVGWARTSLGLRGPVVTSNPPLGSGASVS